MGAAFRKPPRPRLLYVCEVWIGKRKVDESPEDQWKPDLGLRTVS
jgi:hypothetical protein